MLRNSGWCVFKCFWRAIFPNSFGEQGQGDMAGWHWPWPSDVWLSRSGGWKMVWRRIGVRGEAPAKFLKCDFRGLPGLAGGFKWRKRAPHTAIFHWVKFGMNSMRFGRVPGFLLLTAFSASQCFEPLMKSKAKFRFFKFFGS